MTVTRNVAESGSSFSLFPDDNRLLPHTVWPIPIKTQSGARIEVLICLGLLKIIEIP